MALENDNQFLPWKLYNPGDTWRWLQGMLLFHTVEEWSKGYQSKAGGPNGNLGARERTSEKRRKGRDWPS